ncbi:MAG: type IX secretion system protein PorQ [Fluviicola sp.]|nr:type IX secretion system protein PorQ [Fluviicola sp.]
MKTILLIFFASISLLLRSQTGGTTGFQLLDLSFNARSMALAGDFISVMDNDINMGVSNPSLLNPEMDKVISFNSAFQAGGINYGMLSYGKTTKNIGTLAGYIKYVNYGRMQRTNIAGINEGTFRPIELIVGGAIGKQINERLSLGANLNFLYSQLETYNAFGASVDFAGTYYNKDKEFLVTLLAKNVGYQFKSYVDGNRALLPTEIQMAVSYKLKHAPFRFSLLAHHLNKWDITYDDPNLQPTIDPLTGDTIPVKRAGFFEKLANHFTYQLEVIVTKNIDLRIGFDYYRRKELALEQRSGLAGFSFGAGFHFSKFSLDYGFVIYSRAGFNNVITLSTNLSKWKK